jgi:hypothetical protein
MYGKVNDHFFPITFCVYRTHFYMKFAHGRTGQERNKFYEKNYFVKKLLSPITVDARSKGNTVLTTGTVGLTPPRGMDVCLRFSVLCCPVYADDFRWSPTKC